MPQKCQITKDALILGVLLIIYTLCFTFIKYQHLPRLALRFIWLINEWNKIVKFRHKTADTVLTLFSVPEIFLKEETKCSRTLLTEILFTELLPGSTLL